MTYEISLSKKRNRCFSKKKKKKMLWFTVGH